jgi:hypothetical protein
MIGAMPIYNRTARMAAVGPVPPAVLRFFHTGDLGDIIASLPIVRDLGGGIFTIGDIHMQRGLGRRETMEGARYEAIKPLLEAQPYIREVKWEKSPSIVSHDFSTFRCIRNCHGSTIADWQARHLHIPKVDYTPWLTVSPSLASKGRVIVARSSRYHEDEFPWPDILKFFGDRALFVGLDFEHAAFEDEFKVKVEHAQTANLLEVAQAIAGAAMTVVNQTSTFWIACGLGVPIIQETCHRVVDSVVRRPNALYPQNAFDYAEMMRDFASTVAHLCAAE